MLVIKYILFAKSVTVDSRTQNLSVNNILEDLQMPKPPPAILPESSLIISFERDIDKDPSILKTRLLVTLNKITIGDQEIEVDFKSYKRNRVIINFPAMHLQEIGMLKFDFFDDKGKLLGHNELDVRVVEPQNL